MTPRERECLDYIRSHIAEHGYSPTIREIGEALNVKGVQVPHGWVCSLERQGELRRKPGSIRNIELLNPLENVATDDLIAELERRAA